MCSMSDSFQCPLTHTPVPHARVLLPVKLRPLLSGTYSKSTRRGQTQCSVYLLLAYCLDRISVPHATLQAPYKLRPRSKLNSAASMGLSQVSGCCVCVVGFGVSCSCYQHCQSGWHTARPASIPSKPPADLKSFVGDNWSAKRQKTKDLLNTSLTIEYSLLRN